MGALAQVHVVWMPEDDFQLKNAIEGGASLESLAKGAVPFSRRFTLEEIKKRWVSILYDPVISAEVSARVLEVERNSSNLSPKSFRFNGLRDDKGSSKKTKTQSIRDHYYATRKRKRLENQRFIEMELADHQINDGDSNCGIEPQFNSVPGDQTANQLQLFDAGLMNHTSSQVKGDGVTTSCTVVTAQHFQAPEHQLFPENFSVKQANQHQETPLDFGEASLPVDSLQVEKTGILEDVNMCDANGLPVAPHSIFETGNIMDNFDGLLQDCGASFDNLEYPSPLPEIPIWDTIEDISAPLGPVNDNPATQSYGAGEMLPLPQGDHSLDAPMLCLDMGPSESQTVIQNQDCDVRTSDSDEYLAAIYDLLDEGVNDSDDKAPSDNLFSERLSSHLLNSPINAEGHQRSMMVETLASISSDSLQTIDESQHRSFSESQLPLFSLPSQCHSPTERNDVAACIINSEDSFVPNVNDIVLPHVSISVKDLLEKCDHLIMDQKRLGWPKLKGQVCQKPVNSCKHTSVDSKAPSNLLKAVPDISLKNSSQLSDLSQRGHPDMVISCGSDHCIINKASHLETNGFCNYFDNQLGETRDDHAYIRRVDYNGISGPETLSPPYTESEEQIQDSDDEIPYYSDVEEMVLEMDLKPVDHDIKLKEKVSKYHSNDAMKAIVRLEQVVHSHMQRAIARRGAFAVVYGRNCKHYINKSEVLLGRGTGDSYVDIDLGSEGGAQSQKVSRRQAVIKLEADGKFYIKNIGKHPIYKNSVEVGSGQAIRLQSGNLIEIRRMNFIFEENPVCVRRHLRSLP